MEEKKYRLLTKSDLDGLVCASLLKKLGLIEEVAFVHLHDLNQGKIKVSENDILVNLPYIEGGFLSFYHGIKRNEAKKFISEEKAEATAEVIWAHYGKRPEMMAISNEMIAAATSAASAKYTMAEVLLPKGWALLDFITDARTGLGRYRQFRISNYQLMLDLAAALFDHNIEEILEFEALKDRQAFLKASEEKFRLQLMENSKLTAGILVVDFRAEKKILPGNRFLKYALYPQTQISVQIMPGRANQNTVLAVGKSIFNPHEASDVGEIMRAFGGTGHRASGSIQVENHQAEKVFEALMERLQEEMNAK